MKGFKVYSIDATTGRRAAAGRRDWHTIYLLTGPCQWQGADGEIERDGTYLSFGNSCGVGSSKAGVTRQTGYACLFTEEFVQQSGLVENREPWALLAGIQHRSFSLGDQQAAYLTSLFQKMLAEQQSAYCFKAELLGNYLQLVLHEALRLRQPAPKRYFRCYLRLPDSTGVGSAERSRRRG